MSGLLANPCCGCGGKDKDEQCAVHYQFYDTNVRGGFEVYSDPSWPHSITQSLNTDTGTLKLVGTGVYAAAIDTAATPFDTIHIVATISALATGTAGISVRRPYSPDSISLWWLGGNDFELRKGSTVLSLISQGTGTIKLELLTPKNLTTDILVYFDDVLVHTEQAVAFELPEVLNIGATIDGDATFTSLGVSPCPCQPATYTCSDLAMPLYWKTSVNGVGSPTRSGIPLCDGLTGETVVWCPGETEDPLPLNPTLDECAILNGDYTLVGGRLAVAYQSGSGSWDTGLFPPGGDSCLFPSTLQSRNVPYSSVPLGNGQFSPVPPSPPGTIPYLGLTAFTTAIQWRRNCPPWYDRFASCVTIGEHSGWNSGLGGGFPYGVGSILVQTDILGTPIVDGEGNPMVRVTASFRLVIEAENPNFNYQSSVIYRKDFPRNTTDLRTETLTLDFYSVNGCVDYPASLTIEPTPTETKQDRQFFREVLGCNELCEPLVAPVSGRCYMTHLSFVAPDGELYDYTLPMSVHYNEESNSHYWEAQTLASYPYTHPVCGDLPTNLRVKIHCVEPQEGYYKVWVMDIFNDDEEMSRFPVQWDESSSGYEFPYWEGTTGIMCADASQTWDFYASRLDIVDTTAKFGFCEWSVCASPRGHSIYMSYSHWCEGDSPGTYTEGGLLFQQTGSIPPSANASSVDGNVYFSHLGLGVAGGIFLWSEAGVVHAQLVDGHLAAIPGLGSVYGASHSCDPISGQLTNIDDIYLPYSWSNSADPLGGCSGAFGWGEFALYYVHS